MIIAQHVSNPNQLGKITTDAEQQRSYVGEWIPTLVYTVNQVVVELGILYKALGTTTAGESPATHPLQWEITGGSGAGGGGVVESDRFPGYQDDMYLPGTKWYISSIDLTLTLANASPLPIWTTDKPITISSNPQWTNAYAIYNANNQDSSVLTYQPLGLHATDFQSLVPCVTDAGTCTLEQDGNAYMWYATGVAINTTVTFYLTVSDSYYTNSFSIGPDGSQWVAVSNSSYNGLRYFELGGNIKLPYYFHSEAWGNALIGTSNFVVLTLSGACYINSVAPQNLIVDQNGVVGPAGQSTSTGGGAIGKLGTITAGNTQVTITFPATQTTTYNRAVVSGVGANAGQRQIFIKTAPTNSGADLTVVVGIDSSYTEDIDVHVVLAKE